MIRLVSCLSALALACCVVGCTRPVGPKGGPKGGPAGPPVNTPLPLPGGETDKQPIVSAELETGQQDQDTRKLKDPKWLKGPQVAEALVGRWRESLDKTVSPKGYDFNADGTCTIHGGPPGTGTYRLVADNRYLEVMWRRFDGKEATGPPLRYRLLLNDKEMLRGIIYPDGKIAFSFPLLRAP